jgi:quinol monooxygenase YgiN
MPPLSWKWAERAAPDHECLALLTFLPLNRHRHIPGLLLQAMRITRQLRQAAGLFGYSLYAEPAAKRFWTLSAWQGEASLLDFVQAQPHARAMTEMAPRMGETRFLRWTLAGSELPPRWDDALKRWREA